ncbi:MAG: type II toxin-antitoxin system VapC family toxin, partial [Promethearchaeota archaeon]
MDIFYFDANFFIPAGKFKHHYITLKRIINVIRNKYKLKITSLVRKEIRHFDDIIKLYFETERVEDTADFRQFCNASEFAIGKSKKEREHADASLAYSAAHETSNTYIVSNDEGFIRLKNRKPDLLKNVEIIEPTDFMKVVMFEVDDNDFKDEIKALIILYAEHFITYLLEDKRSIGRILESLLTNKEEPMPKVSSLIGVSGTHQLSKEDEIIFENYILNKKLEPSDKKRFKVILDLFKPFIDYYQSFNAENHQLLTKLLYIYFPELLTKLRLISESLEP